MSDDITDELRAEKKDEAKEDVKEESVEKDVKDEEDSNEEEDPLAPGDEKDSKDIHAPQVDINQLHSDPDFALVCSFFNKFGSMIGFKAMPFTRLEYLLTSFDDQGRVPKELVDLHLALMRRIRMLSVRFETWETYLKKFLDNDDAMQGELFQLERYGYAHLPVSSKIQILKALCESQFDFNVRLKETMLTTCKTVDLRLIPVGMDKDGLAYWFQQDGEYNIRVYTEEPDDLSGVTWTLVVRDAEELTALIARLKSEDLGYVKKEKDPKEKEKEKLEPGELQVATKKGTFFDICYDEPTVKKMREKLIKQKEERKMKKQKVESEKEDDDEEEEEKREEEEEDVERRLMPRRSAASRAATNIRKFVTPTKRTIKKKKSKDETNEKEEEEDKEEGEKKEEEEDDEPESGDDDDDDEDVGSDEEEDEDDDDDDDDDEFKLKEKKKKGKKRRRRQKKKMEMEEEEDDDDSDEEQVKERKMATGESACGQCKKSGDWDVLLLCDCCDDAWHTYCLKPVLWFVPDGDWFCPKCVHGKLIERLEKVEESLSEHLKKKAVEDKKKKAAADRLRREMEYIGVSLNNIIPTNLKQARQASSSSSSSDEDDGQRKSKRKAVKRIAPKSRFQMEVLKTIAEGRSRRTVKQVDYNFSEYDTVIQEACAELGDNSLVKPDLDGPAEMVRPTGGAGRGKDMANIIEAEKKRVGSGDEEDGEVERQVGKPARSAPKHRRKLNDLNVDNGDESDSDEYQANASEEEEADQELPLSGSDYVPSEEERRTRRTTRSGRVMGPTQSDEDFVVTDSDESDFGYRGRKKKKFVPKKKKKAKWASDDETEEEEEEDSDAYSDDSEAERKRKKKKGFKPSKREETPEDDEEEEVSAHDSDSDDEDKPRTKTGRPLRTAVVKAKVKDSDDSSEEDEDEEEEEIPKKKEQRPVGALNRPNKRKIDDESEDEFKPEEEEENEEEEEDEEEEEEAPTMVKKAKVLPSDDEDSDDQREKITLKRKKAAEEESDQEDEEDEDPRPKKPKMTTKPSTSKPGGSNGHTSTKDQSIPIEAKPLITKSEPPSQPEVVPPPVSRDTKHMISQQQPPVDPYGAPTYPGWQDPTNPYGPPVGMMPPNPYASVHNPYGPPTDAPPPPGGKPLNDLQSL